MRQYAGSPILVGSSCLTLDNVAASGYKDSMTKKPSELRDTVVRARVTAAQKAAMDHAAQAAGMGLSGWIRWLALRELSRQQPR